MRRVAVSLVVAGAIAGLSCGFTDSVLTIAPGQVPFLCDVTRTECLHYVLQGGTETCVQMGANTFKATTCGTLAAGTTDIGALTQSVCGGAFCQGFSGCTVAKDSGIDNTLDVVDGICGSDSVFNPATLPTQITCAQSGIGCTPGATQVNGQCSDETEVSNSMNICFNSQYDSAFGDCANTKLGDNHVLLTNPHLNATTQCLMVTIGSVLPATTQAYALTPGQTLPYSVAGTSASLQLTGGSVLVGQTCDSDGEFCHPSSLSLNAFVAPTTVFGQLINSPSVSTNLPLNLATDVTTGQSTIAAGSALLAVTGNVSAATAPLFFQGSTNPNAGGTAKVLFQNDAPWTVLATQSGFTLGGAISQAVVSSNGTSTAFSGNVQLTGTPSANVATCAGESAIQNLFGFELPMLWTSTAPLTLVPSPVTQGCAALAFNGSGYQTINGSPFATSAVSVGSALSVDLLVPGNQPNPSWLGALQMYLTCPSGNVFNDYIGQVELTGLPQNQYSTLRFPLPSSTVSTLTRPLSDCSLSFAINVNATGHSWLFDNLRFTN